MRSTPPPALDLFQPGLQSVFAPQGPHAEAVASLAWIMTGGGALIFVVVMALLFMALRRARPRGWGTGFVLVGGLVFPMVALSALLVYSLSLWPRIDAEPRAGDLKIEIIGEQWWWRVHYLDADGRLLFATANEVHLPVGRPVELILKSADVIHSFWVPNLAGKLDMIPGRVNRLRVTAARAGLARGQCAEYCGGPHALMALYVISEEPAAFDAWVSRQREPAARVEASLAPARDLFVQRCGVCHTVRGTAAVGIRGPDLTHVGSRVSLAAGILPNNLGSLAGWIASAQQIKPGNLMPSMNVIGAEEVRAVAAYLEQLD